MDPEREAQIREARARLAEEGEAAPAAEALPSPEQPRRRDEKRRDGRRFEGQPRGGRGGRGARAQGGRRPSAPARTSQNGGRWDPRQAEPRVKETYHHAPQTVAPRITTKRTRSIPALLGRKPEEE
jgi:hypothetical protein